MSTRSTISFLTLTAFLVHAVWGCCTHHTHAAEMPLNDAAEHAHTAASAHHAEGHSHRSPEGLADEEPCENHEHPHQDCGEESCSFAVSSKVKLPTPAIAATVGLLVPVDSSVSILQTASQAAFDFPPGANSAARARQLLQTWLL